MRPPRGSTVSKKYIVDVAQASQAAGKFDRLIVRGQDNTTLGQVSAVDEDVPVGSKVKLLDIRAGFVNLTEANAVFMYWSIQRLKTQQTTLSPISPGGSPKVVNIMLSGILAIGGFQNAMLKVRYKIPKTMQRLADGDQWVLVTEGTNATTAVYQFVYKVFN